MYVRYVRKRGYFKLTEKKPAQTNEEKKFYRKYVMYDVCMVRTVPRFVAISFQKKEEISLQKNRSTYPTYVRTERCKIPKGRQLSLIIKTLVVNCRVRLEKMQSTFELSEYKLGYLWMTSSMTHYVLIPTHFTIPAHSFSYMFKYFQPQNYVSITLERYVHSKQYSHKLFQEMDDLK